MKRNKIIKNTWYYQNSKLSDRRDDHVVLGRTSVPYPRTKGCTHLETCGVLREDKGISLQEGVGGEPKSE